MIALLSLDAQVRQRAIEALVAAPPVGLPFALRRLVATDPDVAVRATAAEALGKLPSTQGADEASVGWLIEAAHDVSPVVRDAAIRALARRRAPGAAVCEALGALAASDPTWWVRRAAIFALGVVAGEAAIDRARAALSDPFWRVRHAAVSVLALCGNRAPERRDSILAELGRDDARGSTDYLRALWGPTLTRELPAAPVASRLPELLRDRDPAVVTARLVELPSASVPALALSLVELLCDPHVPLREAAVARLLEAGELEAFAAALAWLDEPRIPHVAATVTEMLDGLGDPARLLVERVLSGPARPGASRWAIGWVVATHDDDEVLAARAWERAILLDEPELAVAVATPAQLIELLSAPAAGETLRAIAAADELARRPAEVRATALREIPVHAAPRVQLRLVAAVDELASPHLQAALAPGPLDAPLEPDPRAVALATLAAAGKLDEAARAAALVDPDPAIREVVLDGAPVGDLHALLATEGDPWVRRTAGRALARGLRGRPSSAPDRAEMVLALVRDPDPWLRAQALALLDLTRLDHRVHLLELAADPSPMVQAAVIEQLAVVPEAELRAALPVASSAGRAAGQAWLDAGALALAAAPSVERGNHVAVSEVAHLAIEPAASPVRARRTFGRSGVEITPLVISGAFDLAPGSLHVAADAGVELFFWEASYAAMTRFLRAPAQRGRTHVVTGSYHADARSIELDVDRALRRLRRDTLDVFLLFWARSAARLDDAAFATMQRLRDAGKVRAVGFSTHDRELAIGALARAPWDVVMTRHSAAHPGIEAALLPHAVAAGAGVLAFSALCYGRMVSGPGAPSAADCYRYSLSQPGVTACISAPRRHRELIENLDVVAQPDLAPDAMARVRAHGAAVRIEDHRFNTLIRQPTRDAAAAAMAMLEAELAPTEGEVTGGAAAPAKLARSLSAPGRGGAGSRLRRGRL